MKCLVTVLAAVAGLLRRPGEGGSELMGKRLAALKVSVGCSDEWGAGDESNSRGVKSHSRVEYRKVVRTRAPL